MADRSGTAAEPEVATESGAALTPMGQFMGRPDLPLNRAVTTIGSRETCRLQLDSRSISRVHALVVSTDQGAYIADLCSRTGVLVNGRSIRDTNLVGGDRIQLGRFTFRFRASPSSAAAGSGVAPVMSPATPLAMQDGETVTPVPGRAFLIGRRENADLPLTADPEVSTVHAVLFQMDGSWHVRDLASRTGTRVNGTPIETQQRVGLGDTLEIGSALLTLVPAPARAVSPDIDDAALPLDADAPPLADLEPLDFSSIDSIEAGGTDDDAVPTLPEEPSPVKGPAEEEPSPAVAELPLDENVSESEQLRESNLDALELAPETASEIGGTDALEWEETPPAEPTPAEPIAEAIEPAAPPPLEIPEIVEPAETRVEPASHAQPLPTDTVEPSGDAEAPPHVPTIDGISVEEAVGSNITESVAESPQPKPKRNRSRKPAGSKRERPRRKAPGAAADDAVSAETPIALDAGSAAVPSTSLPELVGLPEPSESQLPLESESSESPETAQPSAEFVLEGEPTLPPSAGPPEVADVEQPAETTSARLEDEPLLEPEAATAPDDTAAPVPESTADAPIEAAAPVSALTADAPAEAAADAGRLELSALSDDEEFVAVPEPEETEPAAELLDAELAPEPPAAEAVEPEMDLEFEPLPEQDHGGPVEAVSLPVEPSSTNDWLLGDAPAELPLTAENSSAVESVPQTEGGPSPESVPATAAGLTAAVSAGILLGEAAATTATAAGPGVFGFAFEGGAFLGGAPLPTETASPPPAAAPPPAVAEQPVDEPSERPAADAELLPGSEAEPLLLDDEPAVSASPPTEALALSSSPVPAVEEPVASAPEPPPAPTPIATLSDEIAVPPLATPTRTPPRQRRPLTTDFDGLSNGAKITGFVGGVSVNGRSPAGRGGPSVDVFSQLAPAIGADALAGTAFAPAAPTGPALSRRSPPTNVPPGPAPALEPAASRTAASKSLEPLGEAAPPPRTPAPSAAKPKRRRWPVWGLLGLMFLSLGAVWAAVYALVPLNSRITGTLTFANLGEQSESAQAAFKSDQIARLHSNEVRTIARSILQNGNAPTGFTEDMISLGRALDRDGTAGFAGGTLSVVVRASDPIEGRAQVDALLTALAQRDADLGDTQHRAAQELSDANAAVATARDHLDALKGELPAVRARGEDRPDADELAALQASSDRAERLVTLARSTRLNAEAELDLLRMPLPKPTSPTDAAAGGGTANASSPEDSPRDAQLIRLRWELQDLGRQVNDLKLSRPASAGAAGAAPADASANPAAEPASSTDSPRGDAVNDSLLAFLDNQVQALSTALSDQATGVPGPAGESVRLRQMEALSVRVHSLQQAEKTSQDNAQLALDKLRSLQGRLDSARQATVEIDQLIADIRTAETTLRDKSDAATAAQQQAGFTVAVAGDPSESVQLLSDRRPVYAGVLSGLVLCVFSGLTINALRHEPAPTAVEVLTGEDPDHVIGGGGFDMAEPTEEEEPVGVGDSDLTA